MVSWQEVRSAGEKTGKTSRLFLKDLVGLRAARNESGVDATVEGCQRSPLLNGKRQEVVIGEMFRGRQNGKGAFVAEGNGIGPEFMSGSRCQSSEKFSCGPRRSWTFRVVWMADNSEKGVFRERACQPAVRADFCMECDRRIVVFVVVIAEGNEQVRVEEDHCQQPSASSI